MFCDRRLANYPRWFAEAPEDAAMLVPPIVKQAVVFLGDPDQAPDATGFLVSHPTDPALPLAELIRSHYLVTASHCVPTDGSPRVMRVNLHDGTARTLVAPLRWTRHPDPTVDVAVAPVSLGREVDVSLVPTEMFATPETFKDAFIGEGDEVFIAGLFADAHGRQRNLPIVRTGNIARLTDGQERIVTEFGTVLVHLIEARSRGGMSGSPVFARRTVRWSFDNHANPSHGPLEIVGYGPDFFLLGLVHGHWDDAEHPNDDINMGIGFVVPAHHILEVLTAPDMIAQRREEMFANARTVPKLDGGA